MTNPLVGHVLGSHGHVLEGHVFGHVLGRGPVGHVISHVLGHVVGISQDHVVGVSQGHVFEGSLRLLVFDQALSWAWRDDG